MDMKDSSPIALKTLPRAGIPKNVLLAMGLVLLFTAGLMVAHTVRDEEKRMIAAMKGHADVLIWGLEGATRSMFQMHNPRSPLRNLVEEVAQQPNIVYLAVADGEGRIRAHSEPDREGGMVSDPQELAALSGQKESSGRFVDHDGMRVYEVVKPFTPSIRHSHVMRGHMMRGHMMQRWAESTDIQMEQELFVMVGVDPEPFEASYRDTVHSAILVATLMVLCGVSGLAFFFLVRNYRASRRMLRDARSLTLQVFESLPIGVFTTDGAGTMTLYNKHIAKTFGIPERCATRPTLDEYPVLHWQPLLREMDNGERILERELSLGLPGEAGMPVSLSASPISAADGSFAGYLFIVRDLGEVKKLQQQIRLNERLSSLGNLAAGVAHEIRNPLSSIKGYALYLSGKFAPEDPAYAKSRLMIEEVERLNRVVSDLLSVARIGTVTPVPGLLGPAVQHALRLVESEAMAKGVRLEGPPAEDITVRLDHDRFVQALLNLLINAVQASDAGGTVSVGIVLRPEAHTARVSVRDTGRGMSEAVLAKLFTPYFTTKAEGTGLGLTIAHQIIEQHGGTITVHSRPGQGTVFSLDLPLAEEGETRARPAA